MRFVFLFVLDLTVLFSAHLVFANVSVSDWSEGFSVPIDGRPNPYALEKTDFENAVISGKIHAQFYPVSVTGLLPPYGPLVSFLDGSHHSWFRGLFVSLFKGFSGIQSSKDLFRWIGMQKYPSPQDEGIYQVPMPLGLPADHPMGLGFIERHGTTGFTISCAECHAGNLFGKTVLGLSNRFPRANEIFRRAKVLSNYINPFTLALLRGTPEGDLKLIKEVKQNLKAVGVKQPLVLGLDTSLAQVALSLNRRNPDEYATKSSYFQKFPRKDALDEDRADSKPAVWWNLKYKNRWLSDGSVVSGNPIFTNILWNEIGRGADLVELQTWLENNDKIIQQLTSAVFSSEAPRITDFFSANKINVELAKHGEKVFENHCARCHGHYIKAWSFPEYQNLSVTEKIKTLHVRYSSQTKVVDVGSDPWRYRGMKSLEKLNDLAISKKNGTVVKAQQGYVPPPLVGIWARWPYFHNNSIPNLCALLTPSEQRPSKYYAGEANNPQTDFDFECNGYPLGEKVPTEWKKREFLYRTEKQGLSNQGHDEGIFLEDGQELLSPSEKKALIHFLQTL